MYNERVKRVVNKCMDRYTMNCILEDRAGNFIPFEAIRRAPQASEIGNATVIVYPFIITNNTLSRLRESCGYDDALFCGESIICYEERYQLDRNTPYVSDSGPSASIRLIATKVA